MPDQVFRFVIEVSRDSVWTIIEEHSSMESAEKRLTQIKKRHAVARVHEYKWLTQEGQHSD